MAGRKKKPSPDPSRRSTAKTEEMRKHINSFCGIFKLKPGEKSVVQELIEERRAEKELEDAGFARFSRKKSKSTG